MKSTQSILRLLAAVLVVGALPLLGEETGKKKEGGGVWIVPRAVAVSSGATSVISNDLATARVSDLDVDISEGIGFKLPDELADSAGVLEVSSLGLRTALTVEGRYTESLSTAYLEEMRNNGVQRLDLTFAKDGWAVGITIVIHPDQIDIHIF